MDHSKIVSGYGRPYIIPVLKNLKTAYIMMQRCEHSINALRLSLKDSFPQRNCQRYIFDKKTGTTSSATLFT